MRDTSPPFPEPFCVGGPEAGGRTPVRGPPPPTAGTAGAALPLGGAGALGVPRGASDMLTEKRESGTTMHERERVKAAEQTATQEEG